MLTRIHPTFGWTALAVLLVVALLGIGFSTNGPTTAQGDPTTPPRVYEPAIDAIQQAIPGIGRPDTWRHEIILNSEVAGLGCPTASEDPLPAPVGVWRVWLSYGGTEYLYYVSDDGSIVQPCDPKLPGTPTGEGDGTTRFTSECRIEATLANVRSFPDTSADNVITQLENGSATGIGRTGDGAWFQVQLESGQIGWIADSASTPVGECLTLPVTGNTAIEFGPCPPGFAPGYLPPRISVGATAAIESGGAPNVVRAQPQRSGERLGLYQPGTEIDVLEGPQCGAGFVWWRVTDGQLTGWTVESSIDDGEYFIRLVNAAQPTTPPQTGTGAGTGSGTGTGAGTGTTSGTLPTTPPANTPLITAQNIATLTPVAALPGTTAPTEIVFSPAGDFLAVIDDVDARLYSVPGYQPVQALNTQIASAEGVSATAVAFSADGQYLVMGFDSGFVFLADLTQNIVFRIAIEAGAPINAIAINAQNRMAIASGRAEAPSQLAVYDLGRLEVSTGDVPGLFTQFYETPVFATAFAAADVVVAGTTDALDAYNVLNGQQLVDQDLEYLEDVVIEPVIVPARNFAGVTGVLTSTRIINNLALLGYNGTESFAGTLNTIPNALWLESMTVVPSNPPVLLVAVRYDGAPAEIIALDSATISPLATVGAGNAPALAVSPDGRFVLRVSGPAVQVLAVQ
jgi:hypothetical protein